MTKMLRWSVQHVPEAPRPWIPLLVGNGRAQFVVTHTQATLPGLNASYMGAYI